MDDSNFEINKLFNKNLDNFFNNSNKNLENKLNKSMLNCNSNNINIDYFINCMGSNVKDYEDDSKIWGLTLTWSQIYLNECENAMKDRKICLKNIEKEINNNFK